MRNIKGIASQMRKGEFAGLKNAAQEMRDKAVTGAKTAARTLATKAVQGEVDPALKAVHERLNDLHSTFNELHAALGHQAQRARKTAKTLAETAEPLQSLAAGVGFETRRGVQTAMAVDAAIANRWESYADHLETDLLAPARECSALFTAGSDQWASYVAVVNELAAKQGKERLLAKTGVASAGESVERLHERKAQQEASFLPK